VAWFGKKKKDDDKTTSRQEDARTGRAASAGAKPAGKKGASAPSASKPVAKSKEEELPGADRSARLTLQTHAEGRQVLRPPRQYVNETPYAPPAEPAKNKLSKDQQPSAQESEAPRKSLLRPPTRGYREVGQGASGKETLAQAQERERQELQAQRERALAAKSTALSQAGGAASGIALPTAQELETDELRAQRQPAGVGPSAQEDRATAGQADEAPIGPEDAHDPDELPSDLVASDFEEAFGLTEAQTETQRPSDDQVEPALDNQLLPRQALPSNPFDEEPEGEGFDLPLNSFLTPEEIEEEEQRQKAWADQQRRRDEWASQEERARSESEREAQALAEREAERQNAERAQTAQDLADVAHYSEERLAAQPEGQSLQSNRSGAETLRQESQRTDKNEQEDDMQARLSGAGFAQAESASVEETRQGAIDEAAIVFAAGEEDAAAQKLNDCLTRTPVKGSERVWWMLMDLRQAQNDRPGFEKVAQGYSDKFGNSPPAWRAPRQERANTVNAANVLMLDGAMRGDAVTAQSKPFMIAAREKKSAKIDVARLDPERSSLDVVASLRQVMTTLRKRKVPSLLMGAGPLSRWLLKRVETARAKPAPDQADSEPWLLLLEIFQWQGEEQMAQFEELSLAYSIWFELSGPGWDPAGVMPKPAGRDQEPVREGVIEPESVINEVSGGRLQEKIRAEIERSGSAVVDFASVKRIDFSAAGAFLNFLAQLSGQTQAVTLLEPSELVMALLDVVGVSSYVAVTPRKR